MLALLSLGWRKTARATPKPTRGNQERLPGIEVDELAAPAYHPTPMLKRFWALASASALSMLIGALAAIALAVSLSWFVTTLSDMLRR
jgi:hypothetical protein